MGGAAARKKPREGEEEWAFDYGAVHFTDFTDGMRVIFLALCSLHYLAFHERTSDFLERLKGALATTITFIFGLIESHLVDFSLQTLPPQQSSLHTTRRMGGGGTPVHALASTKSLGSDRTLTLRAETQG